MDTRERRTYDVVGIGFGPSNLSLAIALEEHPVNIASGPLTAAFFERQPTLGWHRGMLLPSAKMQISFLKDLATFRNPTSRFSFISYLHAAGRLPQFVNNQDFFPTRQEFHDYLEWAAARISSRVFYCSETTAIRLPHVGGEGAVDCLQIEVRDGARPGGVRLVGTRNVVVSTGLVPRMPARVERGTSVWHSSEFLERFRGSDASTLKRVAVAGAGQSAAEIVRFLHDALPQACISVIMPSYGYSVADATPFANQVFDPSAVDDYYYGSDRSRDAFWKYHKNTNYSVVDGEVIRDLYQRSYDDEVSGTARLNFLNQTRVEGVVQLGDRARIALYSLATAQTRDLDVDVLVCATGYDSMQPAALLGDLDAFCMRDERGDYRIERDYRIATVPELQCGIYLQGGTENTHGLASSLLSNIAVRSGEIANAIVDRRMMQGLRQTITVEDGVEPVRLVTS